MDLKIQNALFVKYRTLFPGRRSSSLSIYQSCILNGTLYFKLRTLSPPSPHANIKFLEGCKLPFKISIPQLLSSFSHLQSVAYFTFTEAFVRGIKYKNIQTNDVFSFFWPWQLSAIKFYASLFLRYYF